MKQQYQQDQGHADDVPLLVDEPGEAGVDLTPRHRKNPQGHAVQNRAGDGRQNIGKCTWGQGHSDPGVPL